MRGVRGRRILEDGRRELISAMFTALILPSLIRQSCRSNRAILGPEGRDIEVN